MGTDPSAADARASELVVGAGRTDRYGVDPYQELYWVEVQSIGATLAGARRAFDGQAVIASTVTGAAAGPIAAAAAVDAARQAVARSPGGPIGARAPTDLRAAARGAAEAANTHLRKRALASGDTTSPACASIAVALVHRGAAAVAQAGDGAVFLLRANTCRAVGQPPASRSPQGRYLGEADEAAVHAEGFPIEPGDVLVLVSAEVARRIPTPADLALLISGSGTIEAACERLIVETRVRGGEGANSVAVLGYGLGGADGLVSEPGRDRLPFLLALRTLAIPEGAHGGALPEGLADSVASVASAVGLGRPAADEPSVEPPARPTPGARRAREAAPAGSRRRPADAEQATRDVVRARRWWFLLTAVVVLVAAGGWLLATGALPWSWGPAPTSEPSAVVPVEAAPPPRAGPAVTESGPRGQSYVVIVRANGPMLDLDLGMPSAAPIEVVVQRLERGRWRDIHRGLLEPGRTMSVPVPPGPVEAPAFGGGTVSLSFVRTERGDVVWAPSARLSGLPRNCPVSIDERKVYLADRARNLLVVAKCEPEAESAVPAARRAPRVESGG